eukprot:g26415.t1
MLASIVEASIVDCRLNSIARWLTVVVVVVGGLRGHGVHGVRVVKGRQPLVAVVLAVDEGEQMRRPPRRMELQTRDLQAQPRSAHDCRRRRIYPGHGQKFVAKDAKVSFFINAKADSLFHQRIKPVKLRWTQAWRRMNKKGKAQKFQKAIVGMSLDDLKQKKAQRPQLRQAREQAAKEAKAKQMAEKKKTTGNKPAVQKGKEAKSQKLPKGGGAPAGGSKNFKGKK